jgi:hypothetical protein
VSHATFADISLPVTTIECATLLVAVELWCFVLQGDFSANLKLLQSFPSVDVRDVLRTAEALGSLEGL